MRLNFSTPRSPSKFFNICFWIADYKKANGYTIPLAIKDRVTNVKPNYFPKATFPEQAGTGGMKLFKDDQVPVSENASWLALRQW